MTVKRLRSTLVAPSATLVAAACNPPTLRPPTQPTLAKETKYLSVCFRAGDAGESATERALRDALRRSLTVAGYVLLEQACDVALTVSWSIADGAFRTVRVGLRDANDKLIAPIVLSFASEEMLVGDVDRLATTVVNHINASEPLAYVARKKDEQHVISFRPTGVIVRRKSQFVPELVDVDEVKHVYSAMPTGTRVDVQVEPVAHWRSVVQAFDVLLAAGRDKVRVSTNGEVADVDIAAPARWLEIGTWLALGVFSDQIVARWRTDRQCDDVPRSFALDTQSHAFDAMTTSLARCSSGCLDRLILGGSYLDSTPYLEVLLLAARAMKGPVVVDVHGVYRPTPQCAGVMPQIELDAILDNDQNAVRACAPKYKGTVRASLEIGPSGSTDRVNVMYVDDRTLTDAQKTCVARELQRVVFPGQHDVHITHDFKL